MYRTKRKSPPRVAAAEALIAAAREHSTATVMFHAAMAERFGLVPTDSKTLDLLSRLGPLTPGDLVAHTGLTSPSVTALIDRLEARGMVRRRRDDGDRRRVIVELVPEGIAEIAAAYDRFGASLDALWAGYPVAELETIRGFLERATVALRAATPAAAEQ